MMRTALIAIMALAAALAAGCEREADRPIVPQQKGAPHALAFEKEISVLRSVVREDPKNLPAWIKLGNLYMDSERCAEAVEAYGKALELDPSNVNVRVDRGSCFRTLGRPDIAAEHFRKGIEIDPNHPYAHRNLGVVLTFDLRDYKNGKAEFRKYLELSPAASDRAQIEKIISDIEAAEQPAAKP